METMARPVRLHRYQTPVSDSDRWESFVHRPGDIVVCTAPKGGTTWTQMLCALLVHQTPRLPQPLTRLSRWIERLKEPAEVVAADFEAQPWRRILKTHTPLDGLPYFEDVSYVVCGRDPRDAFFSMLDHFANLSAETHAEVEARLGLTGRPDFPTDPNAFFAMWQTVGAHPWTEDGFPFGSFTHFAATYWSFRRLPNLIFLHYADLTEDLDAEMRRLSAFLGIPVDEARWPGLVRAASFAAMKADADAAAPGAHTGEWTSNADFFRAARMGQWREILSPENQALYEELNTRRLEPDLKDWLEKGRAAADPATV